MNRSLLAQFNSSIWFLFGVVIFFSQISIAEKKDAEELFCKPNSGDLCDVNPTRKRNICIFALNSASERKEYFNYFKNYNKKNIENSNVELSNIYSLNLKESDPMKRFGEMAEQLQKKGQTCDFMVVSGHHAGRMWGDESGGSIYFDQLIQDSCDEKYKEFFKNIKSWWLIGCQTNGELITDAESEARRVALGCHDDSGCDYFENLISFGGMTDKNAPYLWGLQAASPNAFIFGYTRKAPLSEKSLFENQFNKTNELIQSELDANSRSELNRLLSNDIESGIISKLLKGLTTCEKCEQDSFAGADDVSPQKINLMERIADGWELSSDKERKTKLPYRFQNKVCEERESKKDFSKLSELQADACARDIGCKLNQSLLDLDQSCKKNVEQKSCKEKFSKLVEATRQLLERDKVSNAQVSKVIAKNFNTLKSIMLKLKDDYPQLWAEYKKNLADILKKDTAFKQYFDYNFMKKDTAFKQNFDHNFMEYDQVNQPTSMRRMAIYSVFKEIATTDGTIEQNLEPSLKKYRSVIIKQVGPFVKLDEYNKFEQGQSSRVAEELVKNGVIDFSERSLMELMRVEDVNDLDLKKMEPQFIKGMSEAMQDSKMNPDNRYTEDVNGFFVHIVSGAKLENSDVAGEVLKAIEGQYQVSKEWAFYRKTLLSTLSKKVLVYDVIKSLLENKDIRKLDKRKLDQIFSVPLYKENQYARLFYSDLIGTKEASPVVGKKLDAWADMESEKIQNIVNKKNKNKVNVGTNPLMLELEKIEKNRIKRIYETMSQLVLASYRHDARNAFDTSSKAILLGVELSTEKQERIALVLSQFDKLDDGFLKEKGSCKVIDDECRREAKRNICKDIYYRMLNEDSTNYTGTQCANF